MQEMWIQSLGQENPLKKEVATHMSILAWENPWTKSPDGLQSMESQRVGHNLATKQHRISTPGIVLPTEMFYPLKCMNKNCCLIDPF